MAAVSQAAAEENQPFTDHRQGGIVMDYDSIIREITQGLTDDPQRNIAYLQEQAQKYKDHEMNTEILRAIGRLIYEQVPEEKRAELQNIIDKDREGQKAVLEEVDFCMYKKDFQKALALLNPLIEKTKIMFQDDAQSEYHDFDEPYEENLYRFLAKPEKELRQASFPFTQFYIRQASILHELGRYEEAIKSCENALKWNPMHAGVMFELIENKKMLHDMESYFRLTQATFKKVFRPSDLAHCYRNLAYWFVEQELYREAVGCLLLSLQFGKSQLAQSELFYIQEKAGKQIKPPTEKQFAEIAKKYDFPIGPDEDAVGLAYFLGKHSLEIGRIDAARYYLTIVNDLLHDETVGKLLEELP